MPAGRLRGHVGAFHLLQAPDGGGLAALTEAPLAAPVAYRVSKEGSSLDHVVLPCACHQRSERSVRLQGPFSITTKPLFASRRQFPLPFCHMGHPSVSYTTVKFDFWEATLVMLTGLPGPFEWMQ